MIACDGVERSFGVRKALDGVTFDLPQGAFLSIFGPNGAGKTTLLKTMTTLLPPSKGTVRVCDMDVVTDAVELRSRLGLISHNPLLYPDLSAEQDLEFFADMYGIEDPGPRIRELLESVELDHRKLDLVRTFSRGMTQRLSIARALLHDPDGRSKETPSSALRTPNERSTLSSDSIISGQTVCVIVWPARASRAPRHARASATPRARCPGA
jgi:heme exporter protein A